MRTDEKPAGFPEGGGLGDIEALRIFKECMDHFRSFEGEGKKIGRIIACQIRKSKTTLGGSCLGRVSLYD